MVDPMDCIYLDNNATTAPAPEVVDAMTQALRTRWANPSSVHRPRQFHLLPRASVAQLIGVKPRTLVFTSGGTEANNLALQGTRPRVLLTTAVEHSAIREPAEALAQALPEAVRVVRLPLVNGLVEPHALRDALQRETLPGAQAMTLVSIQWANNETGVIQPIAQLAQVVAEVRSAGGLPVLLHTDATQAVGKIPVDATAAGVDLLTLAAHKFHGPKGAGALYVRRGVRLTRQLHGGPQEMERRGGTENTVGVLGLGVAAQLAQAFVADEAQRAELAQLRDHFEQLVCAGWPATVVHGQDQPRLWNTSNLGFPRLEAEAILLALSEQGVCASAGAACSSGSLEPSPVLLALGIPEIVAHGSVRFSLSRHTTGAEVERAAELVVKVVTRLARTLPV